MRASRKCADPWRTSRRVSAIRKITTPSAPIAIPLATAEPERKCAATSIASTPSDSDPNATGTSAMPGGEMFDPDPDSDRGLERRSSLRQAATPRKNAPSAHVASSVVRGP